MKGASEFGITAGKQKLAAMLIFLSDIHSLGLQLSQGLNLTESFYWDLDANSRAWSKRFGERMGGRMPTMVHASVYSAVTHYLKSIKAAGTDNAETIAAKMAELKVSDQILQAGEIRKDGRVLRPFYLFEVKSSGGIEGAVRLLQASSGDLGRRGCATPGRQPLPAGQIRSHRCAIR